MTLSFLLYFSSFKCSCGGEYLPPAWPTTTNTQTRSQRATHFSSMAKAMFPTGVFSVGGEMMEDEGSSLSELPGSLPVPQLVMLANAAMTVGGAESAAEEEGGSCDGLVEVEEEEKEMVELKTVGCSYSDSEGESVR